MADEPKTEDSFAVVEIPETMKLAIKSPEGDFLDIHFAMARILNELKEIKKSLA